MMGTLFQQGFVSCSEPDEAEVIILNTCGFLASAVTESIDRILELIKYKEAGNCRMLIAAGCLIERYREKLVDEIPEIDGLIGTTDYTSILNCINNFFEGNNRQILLTEKPLYSEKNRSVNRVLSTQYHAYLKIAEGCSNACSFCNIPKLRGRQVSKPFDVILKETTELLKSGIKEINLISQDCSAYGSDFRDGTNLHYLVESILKENEGEFWLRIFYTYPNNYPLNLLEVMNRDERLVPYIDLPFQHISDPVLKAMNRRIVRKDLERILDKAITIVPDVALRTTFIVGFPNETEKDFKELLSFVEQGYFNHLGVFTYSHEDNIRSYQLGDLVPDELKNERREVLMAAQQAVSKEKNRAMVGQIQKVLVEGEYEETELLLKGRNCFQGVEVDGVVLINEGTATVGQFNQVKITDAHPYDLIGGIISEYTN